ncbi:hypothetical protein FNF31_02015 [Cafeteria roenbergensis]|uniref:Ion transport domain-containing protein n=1 Tax=Cafeteria roenbergensis TaxID=33653 RepID=A0A5A8DIL2_CAFRO|nr:hypothetical protein FNF31_02015 [Cafeteria roenbergensis]
MAASAPGPVAGGSEGAGRSAGPHWTTRACQAVLGFFLLQADPVDTVSLLLPKPGKACCAQGGVCGESPATSREAVWRYARRYLGHWDRHTATRAKGSPADSAPVAAWPGHKALVRKVRPTSTHWGARLRFLASRVLEHALVRAVISLAIVVSIVSLFFTQPVGADPEWISMVERVALVIFAAEAVLKILSRGLLSRAVSIGSGPRLVREALDPDVLIHAVLSVRMLRQEMRRQLQAAAEPVRPAGGGATPARKANAAATDPDGLPAERLMPEGPTRMQVKRRWKAVAIERRIRRRDRVAEPGYLQNAWDVADLLVLVVMFVDVFSEGVTANVTVLRALRVFRVVRTVEALPGLQVILVSLFRSCSFLFNVLVVMVFFYFVFAIIGVESLGLSLQRRCVDTSAAPLPGGGFPEAELPDPEPAPFCVPEGTPASEAAGLICSTINPAWRCADTGSFPLQGLQSFQNVLYGLYVVVQAASLEGWSDLAYAVLGAEGPLASVYFVLVVFVCNFLVLSLVTSVLIQQFGNTWEAFIARQREEKAAQAEAAAAAREQAAIEAAQALAANVARLQAAQTDSGIRGAGGLLLASKMKLWAKRAKSTVSKAKLAAEQAASEAAAASAAALAAKAKLQAARERVRGVGGLQLRHRVTGRTGPSATPRSAAFQALQDLTEFPDGDCMDMGMDELDGQESDRSSHSSSMEGDFGVERGSSGRSRSAGTPGAAAEETDVPAPAVSSAEKPVQQSGGEVRTLLDTLDRALDDQPTEARGSVAAVLGRPYCALQPGTPEGDEAAAGWCSRITMSNWSSQWFASLVTSLSATTLVILGLEDPLVGQDEIRPVDAAAIAMTCLIGVELAFRAYALRGATLRSAPITFFDVIAFASGVLATVFFVATADGVGSLTEGFGSVRARVFMSLTALRSVRLVEGLAPIRNLVLTAFRRGGAIANLIALLGLVTCVAGLFATQLFGGSFTELSPGEELPEPRLMFYSAPQSILVLFIVITGENWPSVLGNVEASGTPWGKVLSALVVLWYLATNVVLLQIFIAVVVEGIAEDDDVKVRRQLKSLSRCMVFHNADLEEAARKQHASRLFVAEMILTPSGVAGTGGAVGAAAPPAERILRRPPPVMLVEALAGSLTAGSLDLLTANVDEAVAQLAAQRSKTPTLAHAAQTVLGRLRAAKAVSAMTPHGGNDRVTFTDGGQSQVGSNKPTPRLQGLGGEADEDLASLRQRKHAIADRAPTERADSTLDLLQQLLTDALCAGGAPSSISGRSSYASSVTSTDSSDDLPLPFSKTCKRCGVALRSDWRCLRPSCKATRGCVVASTVSCLGRLLDLCETVRVRRARERQVSRMAMAGTSDPDAHQADGGRGQRVHGRERLKAVLGMAISSSDEDTDSEDADALDTLMQQRAQAATAPRAQRGCLSRLSAVCGIAALERFQRWAYVTRVKALPVDSQDRALGCLPARHPVRGVAHACMCTRPEKPGRSGAGFRNIMLLTILLSSLQLATEGRSFRRAPGAESTLRTLDIVFAAIFAAEAVLKITAFGLVAANEHSYLRRGWNVLDLVVAVFAVIDAFVDSRAYPENPVTGLPPAWVSIIRLARCLRPLKFLEAVPATSRLVRAFSRSLGQIVAAVVLSLILLLSFGVLGRQFFAGAMGECSDASVHLRENCQGLFVDDSGETALRVWTIPTSSFESLPAGVTTLLETATLEGWIPTLTRCMDISGRDTGPVENASVQYALFFIIFIVLAAFVIFPVFTGIVANAVALEREDACLTDQQKTLRGVLQQYAPPGDRSVLRKAMMPKRHGPPAFSAAADVVGSDSENDGNVSRRDGASDNNGDSRGPGAETPSRPVPRGAGISVSKKWRIGTMSRSEDADEPRTSGHVRTQCEAVPNDAFSRLFVQTPLQRAHLGALVEPLRSDECARVRCPGTVLCCFPVPFFAGRTVAITTCRCARDCCPESAAACVARSRGCCLCLCRTRLCGTSVWDTTHHAAGKLVNESRWFDLIATTLVVLNALAMAFTHSPMEATAAAALDTTNTVFLAIFTVELLIRLTAHGCGKPLYKDWWLVFDFVVVVASIALRSVNTEAGVQAARALRIARLFRVMHLSRRLRVLVDTLASSVSALGSVTFTLLLVLFVYAVMGMQLFGAIGEERSSPSAWPDQPQSAVEAFNLTANSTAEQLATATAWALDPLHQQYEGFHRFAHFRDFFSSLLLLFRMATGEDWQRLYHDAENRTGMWANIFFVSFVILVQAVVLDFYLAGVLEAFERAYHEQNDLMSYRDVALLRTAFDRYDEHTGTDKAGFVPLWAIDRLLARFAGLPFRLTVGWEVQRRETEAVRRRLRTMEGYGRKYWDPTYADEVHGSKPAVPPTAGAHEDKRIVDAVQRPEAGAAENQSARKLWIAAAEVAKSRAKGAGNRKAGGGGQPSAGQAAAAAEARGPSKPAPCKALASDAAAEDVLSGPFGSSSRWLRDLRDSPASAALAAESFASGLNDTMAMPGASMRVPFSALVLVIAQLRVGTEFLTPHERFIEAVRSRSRDRIEQERHLAVFARTMRSRLAELRKAKAQARALEAQAMAASMQGGRQSSVGTPPWFPLGSAFGHPSPSFGSSLGPLFAPPTPAAGQGSARPRAAGTPSRAIALSFAGSFSPALAAQQAQAQSARDTLDAGPSVAPGHEAAARRLRGHVAGALSAPAQGASEGERAPDAQARP